MTPSLGLRSLLQSPPIFVDSTSATSSATTEALPSQGASFESEASTTAIDESIAQFEASLQAIVELLEPSIDSTARSNDT